MSESRYALSRLSGVRLIEIQQDLICSYSKVSVGISVTSHEANVRVHRAQTISSKKQQYRNVLVQRHCYTMLVTKDEANILHNFPQSLY